jgi:AraC-like DNA-binding protein
VVVNLRSGGVLNLRAGQKWFDHSLHSTAPELAELIEHYWSVRWDRRGRDPYPQHTLSNAAVHLVINRDRSRIQGVVTGRFTALLEGTGRVFGVKFRPAGFRPFLGSSVTALTDRSVAVCEVFGRPGDALVDEILALEDEPAMAGVADTFLRDRLPPPDPTVDHVNQIVQLIVSDRSITRVDDVVDRVGVGKRTLQRLFSEYVGVTPKWVIQRYRLHEAADRLADGDDISVAALAQDLGYFDQAHFVRDFKAIVGRPPGEYARAAGQP